MPKYVTYHFENKGKLRLATKAGQNIRPLYDSLRTSVKSLKSDWYFYRYMVNKIMFWNRQYVFFRVLEVSQIAQYRRQGGLFPLQKQKTQIAIYLMP